jgi:hypothetical protein
MDQLSTLNRQDGGAAMTPARKQHATDALLALTLAALIVLGVRAHAATSDVFLPIVRGAPIRVTGAVYPPVTTFCMLQTSAAYAIDPRTDTAVYGCESKDGHGYIVFGDGGVLLLDHVAAGSGSLTVVDGAVYVVAAREDGGLQVQEVPRP